MTDKHDDPLAGVRIIGYLKDDHSGATSFYRPDEKPELPYREVVSKPAVRKVVAQAVRLLLKYDKADKTIKVDPQAVVQLADRLERGGKT